MPACLYKPGEWNTFLIRVQGPSIKLTFNGKDFARFGEIAVISPDQLPPASPASAQPSATP